MPRRSERVTYADAFEGNPFEGLGPSQVYRRLRWGERERERWAIVAPEPLASLGIVARLDYGRWSARYGDEGTAPFLAVGTRTNRLYVVPRDAQGGPVDIGHSVGPTRRLGLLRRTDYVSVKGGQDAYYYHRHERPFPTLRINPRTGVQVVVPARMRGRRSYAVSDAGIVG